MDNLEELAVSTTKDMGNRFFEIIIYNTKHHIQGDNM
jgi:hypothetical protein